MLNASVAAVLMVYVYTDKQENIHHSIYKRHIQLLSGRKIIEESIVAMQPNAGFSRIDTGIPGRSICAKHACAFLEVVSGLGYLIYPL